MSSWPGVTRRSVMPNAHRTHWLCWGLCVGLFVLGYIVGHIAAKLS